MQEVGTIWTLASSGLPVLPPEGSALRAAFGHTIAVGDFNGDSKDELAIAHRQLATSTAPGSLGAVVVLEGSTSGLSAQGSRTLIGSAIDENSEQGFGDAMAVADFNGDGFDDLAVGASGRGDPVAGKVYVFAGGPGGLDPLQAQTWHRDVEGIQGVAGDEDGFGAALVTGDFDGDGFADLVIAAGKGFEAAPAAHAVAHVLFGSKQGLSTDDAVALEFPAAAGAADDINPRLSVDTNTDGSDELLVTFQVTAPQVAPLACLAHALRSESVAWACFGEHSPHTTSITSDPGGMAAGDFDGDGHADIAFGQSAFPVDGRPLAGSVQLWLGAGSAVCVLEPEFQVLISTVADGPGSFGRFGTNLVAADLDDDGNIDLAIGEPGHSASSSVQGAGMVHLYRGSGTSSGLVPFASIAAGDIASLLPLESQLRLGAVLATADFDGNGCPDIAAALPSRQLGGLMGAGAVAILQGGQHTVFQDGFEN